MNGNILTASRPDSFAVLKALCMLGLPLVHIIETLNDIATLDTSVVDLTGIIVLTVLGPAVFMVIMGIEQGKGGRARQFAVLGVQMILIGIILNVFRDIIPFAIYGAAYPGEISADVVAGYIFESDIYFFVGFFMLFYSLMKKLRVSLFGTLMVSFIMLAVNTVFVYSGIVITDNIVLERLLGNFIYAGPGSCFPLLGWAVVPVTGICFAAKFTGKWQSRISASRLSLASGVCLAAVVVTLLCLGFDVMKTAVPPANAYKTDLFSIVIQILAAFFAVGIIQIILNHKKSGPVERFFARISVYLMPYYFISWVFVSIASMIIGLIYSTEVPIDAWVVITAAAAVTLASLAFSMKAGMKLMRLLLLVTDFGRHVRRKRRKECA